MKEQVAEQYPEHFALFHFSLGRLRGIGVARDQETGMVRFPTELGELLELCFGCTILAELRTKPSFFLLVEKKTLFFCNKQGIKNCIKIQEASRKLYLSVL
ncbi:MAG: hypothetical protein Q3M30_10010 [Candidatus Electrothrix sp. Rat3]|nr:hypothetical protein [Candidatus Electrothrix rattekaaiensis]